VNDRPPEVVVVEDEVLQVDVVARPPDRSKERIELILSPGVEIDPVLLGQVRPVVPEEEKDRVAKLLRLRGGEPVAAAGERTVLHLEDLPEKRAVLLLFDDEHPLPGVVLPEDQVERKADRREEEEDHQPRHRRRRAPPLEEDDGDGKYAIEDQDDAEQQLQFHLSDFLPGPSTAILFLRGSISV
jgi:hypothetical protein